MSKFELTSPLDSDYYFQLSSYMHSFIMCLLIITSRIIYSSRALSSGGRLLKRLSNSEIPDFSYILTKAVTIGYKLSYLSIFLWHNAISLHSASKEVLYEFLASWIMVLLAGTQVDTTIWVMPRVDYMEWAIEIENWMHRISFHIWLLFSWIHFDYAQSVPQSTIPL